MGRGAILLGQLAEMVGPSLLLFAIVYAAARNSLQLRYTALSVLGLWLLTLVTSGFLNIALYSVTSNEVYGSFVLLGIPLVVSLFIIYFFAPRKVPAASGGTPNKSLERTREG
jgi:hypothetical protein